MRASVSLLVVSLALLLPARAGAEPRARSFEARAWHLHGNCGPLPRNSPAEPGPRREGGARVLVASAHHPFHVGHYGPGLGGAYLWLGARRAGLPGPPGPAGRGLSLELPLGLDCAR